MRITKTPHITASKKKPTTLLYCPTYAICCESHKLTQ